MHDGPPCPRPGQPSPCPPWCTADHEAEMQRRREMAAAVDRQLGVPPLRSVDSTEVESGRGLVVDTYLLHTVEVGQVTVRAGAAEEPATLRVELQQLEDVDGTAGGSAHSPRLKPGLIGACQVTPPPESPPCTGLGGARRRAGARHCPPPRFRTTKMVPPCHGPRWPQRTRVTGLRAKSVEGER